MDPNKIWSEVLNEIKPKVSPVNFKGWLSQADAISLQDNKLTLSVGSAFFENQLRARYLNLILETLKKITDQDISVDFKIDPSKLSKKTKDLPSEDFFEFSSQPQNLSYSLNPKYTLENFVVGLSNNVAFAAAQAIVQNPGTSYNPLLLYGGTGVGKTHLMLGIGNALLNKNPAMKVKYSSSEQFTNDYVAAIKEHKMEDFRNRYRSVDILLLDDIQFFSGREGTQEEFFHTFNALQGKNSQIILTSDRAPGEIVKVEDRLKSRFQGGLMVDIQTPDFDTRVAILKAKCQEKGENLPEDALKLIASSLDTNIRELEGRLIQIIQKLKANNLEASIENISSFIQTSVVPANFDYKKVISVVCNYFNMTQKDLTGPNRQKELVLPRHLTMFLLCEELNFTVQKAGQILGGRDHTTVMHGRDRIKRLMNTDRDVQKTLIEIKQR